MCRITRLLTVSLLLISVSCQRDAEGVDPAVDGKPRIVGLRIDGIPQQNITIDQQKQVVSVTMPSRLSTTALTPTFTLTTNAKLLAGPGVNQPFRPVNFYNGCYDEPFQLAYSSMPTDVAFKYAFQVIAPGRLQSDASQQPIDATVAEFTTVRVPLQNLYGASPVVEARVSRTGSPDKITVAGGGPGNACVWFTADLEQANQLTFTIKTLPPGMYQLELLQANGQVVVVQQPLLVKKGTAALREEAIVRTFGVTAVQTAGTFVLTGYNLFAEDIAVEISQAGRVIARVRPDQSAPDGTSMRVPLPDSLKPGYYQMQLLQNGTPTLRCLRLNVTRTADQPTLGLFGQRPDDCNTVQPLVYQRGAVLPIAFRYPSFYPFKATVRLSTETGTPTSFDIPVSLPSPTAETSPKFTIPTSVPTGQYQLRLLLTEADGRTHESEPFDRVAEVR